MMIEENNPFTSQTFVNTWLKYYNESRSAIKFDFFEGLEFIKNKGLPLYSNVGSDMTNGLFYTLYGDKVKKPGNRVFLVHDVPSYFAIPEFGKRGSLQLKKINQYRGYMIDLTKYKDIDGFLAEKLPAKERSKYRRRLSGLTSSFDVDFTLYHGSIERDTYDMVFDTFKALLKKRYLSKKIDYHVLKKWNYYRDLVYPMIHAKEASLMVVYENSEPIGISLHFHTDTIFIGAITVYDIDYYKFSVGKIMIIKLIEWCLEKKFEVFDFSKGHFDYKEKLSDITYVFDYHILYYPKNLVSNAIATGLGWYYRLKQYLRVKNVNLLYRRVLFLLHPGENHKGKSGLVYRIMDDKSEVSTKDAISIDFRKREFGFLKIIINNFLYIHREHINDIAVFRQGTRLYQIRGKREIQWVAIEKEIRG
ncbi:GNAT family N-acetyltransferase [Flavobacteriaceae bacterium 3-367]